VVIAGTQSLQRVLNEFSVSFRGTRSYVLLLEKLSSHSFHHKMPTRDPNGSSGGHFSTGGKSEFTAKKVFGR
jgi:hypothetical protein